MTPHYSPVHVLEVEFRLRSFAALVFLRFSTRLTVVFYRKVRRYGAFLPEFGMGLSCENVSLGVFRRGLNCRRTSGTSRGIEDCQTPCRRPRVETGVRQPKGGSPTAACARTAPHGVWSIAALRDPAPGIKKKEVSPRYVDIAYVVKM